MLKQKHAKLSCKDVAQRLGVHRNTVYRLVKAGHLNAIRIGGIYRFRESDIEEFMCESSTKEKDVKE